MIFFKIYYISIVFTGKHLRQIIQRLDKAQNNALQSNDTCFCYLNLNEKYRRGNEFCQQPFGYHLSFSNVLEQLFLAQGEEKQQQGNNSYLCHVCLSGCFILLLQRQQKEGSSVCNWLQDAMCWTLYASVEIKQRKSCSNLGHWLVLLWDFPLEKKQAVQKQQLRVVLFFLWQC